MGVVVRPSILGSPFLVKRFIKFVELELKNLSREYMLLLYIKNICLKILINN